MSKLMGLFGDEDEGEEVAATEEDDEDDDEGGESDEEDDDETTIGSDPEDDVWLFDFNAVMARGAALKSKIDTLYLSTPVEESQEGRFKDFSKNTLQEDILAFNGQCYDVKAKWSGLTDAEKGDWVFALEDEAAILEVTMQQYQGSVDEYDAKLEEKLAIIARVIQPIQNQVFTAEALLKAYQSKVESAKKGVADTKLTARVNAGLNIFNIMLSAFPPTAILGTGMSMVQMGMQPSESGGAGIGADFGGMITKSGTAINKLAGGVGALANAVGYIDQLKEDRDNYSKACQRLRTAIVNVNNAAVRLQGLMAQFSAQMAKAQTYATKATGV